MKLSGKNPWSRPGRGEWIAPSLLSCDFLHVGREVDTVTAAGADVLHVDIMDGHFVPNLSMGTDFVAKLRQYTALPLDVHIMVTDPAFYIERFAEAGADSISFHLEAADNPRELVDRLHRLGLGAGIVLKPETGAERIAELSGVVDLVLVMTVDPGFGGRPFQAEVLPKVQRVREMVGEAVRVEVDGGIAPETAQECVEAGADVLVAGHSIFDAPDEALAIAQLREAARRGRRA